MSTDRPIIHLTDDGKPRVLQALRDHLGVLFLVEGSIEQIRFVIAALEEARR